MVRLVVPEEDAVQLLVALAADDRVVDAGSAVDNKVVEARVARGGELPVKVSQSTALPTSSRPTRGPSGSRLGASLRPSTLRSRTRIRGTG